LGAHEEKTVSAATGSRSKQRVLVTGAAGLVGQLVATRLADRYEFVLTDVRPLPLPSALPFTPADLADLDAIRSLCQGAHTVLHLATVGWSGTWESLLQSDIVGTYNVFLAPTRRVAAASSSRVASKP
jgi:uronate dehydrogenase